MSPLAKMIIKALENEEDDIVYITSKGSRYHLKNCKYLENSNNVHKVMLRTAISKGYVACKVCNPYGMAGTTETVSNEVEAATNDNFNSFILVMTIGVTTVLIVLAYYFRNTNFVSNLLHILMISCYIIIPIVSCLLHIYTVYLYSMNYGFLGALLSFCLPVFSEIFMLFDYIFAYGIFNSYLGFIVGYILIYVVLIGIHYLLEKD